MDERPPPKLPAWTLTFIVAAICLLVVTALILAALIPTVWSN